jgi:hypothetical protein
MKPLSITKRILLTGLILVFPLIFSCKKNKEVDLNPILNASNDNMISYRAFIQVFRMLVKASVDSTVQSTGHGLIDGAVIAYDSLADTYTFLYQGNQGSDSVIRYGYYTVDLTGDLYSEGTKGEFTFVGYGEDSHLITGQDSVVNEGILGGVSMKFNMQVRDAMITKDSIRKIYLQTDLSFYVDPVIQHQGFQQQVIFIQGTALGLTSMGLSFSSSISSPLEDHFNCPWIREGIISVDVPSAEASSATMIFQGQTACTDRINYDFNGILYQWRIQEKYLKY